MTHPYARHEYAETLSHMGRALQVPQWGCSVLIREFMGAQDAIGAYPLSILRPDAEIVGGLKTLREAGLVSVTLVLDDFHRPELEKLHQHFGWFKPFKTHYIYRLEVGEPSYDRHHRYELKQAHKHLQTGLLDWKRDKESWVSLYSNLAVHRNLQGTHLFPLEHHQFLSEAEGVTALGAWKGDELVSAHIYVFDGKKVHSHLAASSEQGYALRAAYAVNDAAIKYFKNAELINFGGGAGFTDDPNDGLARFKRGFSNGVAQSYICGAILDEVRYAELVQITGVSSASAFFPAYRAPKHQAP